MTFCNIYQTPGVATNIMVTPEGGIGIDQMLKMR